MKPGAHYTKYGVCTFVVWAPRRERVELRLAHPDERLLPMKKLPRGYWEVEVQGIPPGSSYFYRLDSATDRPDPASHFQPDGVHGPSALVDHDAFAWHDEKWQGIELSEMIIYELHSGTFTPAGTFDAVIPRIPELGQTGINAIEIMPVGEFPGNRNWGYDGAYPFSVHSAYGGPEALKRLVDACHREGIAVILDIVCNHLGPEGNYLSDFGPYFTSKYKTPWGDAVNFDDAYSDEVRSFFIESALHWLHHYHIDALRLDAVHAIFDQSATPFLTEMADEVKTFSRKSGRPYFLIAESDRNDSRLITPEAAGGLGLHALWCDDFHHAVHSLLTGEKEGYYSDFGEVRHLVKSIGEGFTYSGEYSRFRKRRHGNSSKERPPSQFVVFSQNHDQVGNRMLGERTSGLVGFEGLKLSAGLVILSPYVPLLFMGEEYGEEAPFLYFVSHSDPGLIEAVKQGRKEEFESFAWRGEPPDPQDPQTFLRSKLHWEARKEGSHGILLDFYRTLIQVRKQIRALCGLERERLKAWALEREKLVFLERWGKSEADRVLCLFNLNKDDVPFVPGALADGRAWKKVLDSSSADWNGPGTLLPDTLDGDEIVVMKGHGLGVYFTSIAREP
jgi:maltooligosyltrehalose trehalohydrolase